MGWMQDAERKRQERISSAEKADEKRVEQGRLDDKILRERAERSSRSSRRSARRGRSSAGDCPAATATRSSQFLDESAVRDGVAHRARGSVTLYLWAGLGRKTGRPPAFQELRFDNGQVAGIRLRVLVDPRTGSLDAYVARARPYSPTAEQLREYMQIRWDSEESIGNHDAIDPLREAMAAAWSENRLLPRPLSP